VIEVNANGSKLTLWMVLGMLDKLRGRGVTHAAGDANAVEAWKTVPIEVHNMPEAPGENPLSTATNVLIQEDATRPAGVLEFRTKDDVAIGRIRGLG